MTESRVARTALFGLWLCMLGAVGCAQATLPASTVGPAVELSASGAAEVPDDVRNPYAPPVYALRTVTKPPVIDGKLDDEAWRGVGRLGRMYLDSGIGPMKFDTIARLARDADYLYLSVDCKHPSIKDVPVRQGTRDRVSWAGETVELFIHTDRSASGYVQVIFDMSGAFTDTFAGNPGWDGDITAATDVGGEGWRLEARLKIADLAGGDGRKTDPHLWGCNLARNTRGQGGSWARIKGSYQQPDLFGLLTMAQGPLAVEDLAVGLYAPAGEDARAVPVRMRVRNLSAQRQDVIVAATSTAGAARTSRQELVLPAQAAKDVIVTAGAHATNVGVSISRAGAAPGFRATLPIRRLKTPADCVADEALACAVRPASRVWLTREPGRVYLLAQSLGGPWQSDGTLSLRPADDLRPVWQCPVKAALPSGAEAAARADIPVQELKPGSYVLEWKSPGRPAAQVGVDYIPLDRQWLDEVKAIASPVELLKKMNCPLPKESRDLALVQVRLERLAALIEEQEGNIEIDLAAGMAKAYRQLTEVVTAIKATGRYARDQRGWFETAFFSPADGSAQPYSLFVPYDYAPDRPASKPYPLVVMLHGAGSTHGGDLGYAPGQDKDKIADRLVLRPLARGKVCGYDGVAGNDVLQEIAEAKRHYRIDDGRVHLTGGSMGGFGSFCIGSQYPDLFATCKPVCGGGSWYPVEQMLNLPTYVHHGLADGVVAPSRSMMTVEKMKHYGCPVQLYLHPGIGHDVGGVADAITTWDVLKDIRRDSQPRSVIVSGNLLSQTRAYWLSVAKFADVRHGGGFARATFVGENHLDIQARNVEWLRVQGPPKWLRPGPLQITMDGGRLWTEFTPKLAAMAGPIVYIHITPTKVEATQEPPKELADATRYQGGGAGRMFSEGRAVKIVYGTLGDQKRKAASEALAKAVRRMSFTRGDFQVGAWPLLKDTAVTPEIMAANDLILLGGPEANALVARMAKDLPVKLSDGKMTVEADAPMQWPADEVAFRLYYRNPLAPDRRVWWLFGADTKDRLEQLAQWEEKNESLVVQRRAKPALLGNARADEQWRLHRPAPLTPANQVWKDRKELLQAFSQALKDAMPVDLIVQSQEMDEYNPVDWSSVTAGEMTGDLENELFVASLSGRDLKRLRVSATAPTTAPAKDRPPTEWIWAGLSPAGIEDGRTYRLLADDPTIDQICRRGIDIRVLDYVPADRLEPIAQRYLKSVGVVAATGGSTESLSE